MPQTPVNTTYFPEDIVRNGINGCCHDFAFALHRQTCWKIGALWSDPIIDKFTIFTDPSPVHLFCYAPDGRPVDVEGPHRMKDFLTTWTRTDRPVTMRLALYENEAAWVAAAEDNSMAQLLLPNDYKIENATACLKASDKFQSLIRTLQPASRPQTPSPG